MTGKRMRHRFTPEEAREAGRKGGLAKKGKPQRTSRPKKEGGVAYVCQRKRANVRGIEWMFTHESWLKVWKDSGKWELRGRRKGQYVMSRFGDQGPYSPSNVNIVLSSDNVRERMQTRQKPGETRIGKGRGWTFDPQRFQPYVARFRKKVIGCFSTPEEARSAYLAAAERAISELKE